MRREVTKKYKAIIFDLDGTLINSLPYHLLAFKKLFEKHNLVIDYSLLSKNMGLSTENILRLLKRKYKFEESLKDLHEERRKYYYEIISKKDILFPGVKALLKKLRPNYRLAIATGSSKVTLSHSIDKRFQENFDFISTIDDVKKGKPDPKQLLLIAKKLKVKTSECLMIGDSFYDGLTASNAKVDFIGVLTGYTSKKELVEQSPIAILKKITDLSRVL